MGGFGKCSKIITFHLISRGEHSHKRSQSEKKNIFVLNGSHVLLFFVFCNVLSVCFCTGFFVVVPLQLTYLHGFQQFSFFIYCMCVTFYWCTDFTSLSSHFHKKVLAMTCCYYFCNANLLCMIRLICCLHLKHLILMLWAIFNSTLFYAVYFTQGLFEMSHVWHGRRRSPKTIKSLQPTAIQSCRGQRRNWQFYELLRVKYIME